MEKQWLEKGAAYLCDKCIPDSMWAVLKGWSGPREEYVKKKWIENEWTPKGSD